MPAEDEVMLRVGDTIADMHPVEFNGKEPVPTGLIWFVPAVEPRDDGKLVVELERYDCCQMYTSTMVCTSRKDAA
jgi:hypothetical protein